MGQHMVMMTVKLARLELVFITSSMAKRVERVEYESEFVGIILDDWITSICNNPSTGHYTQSMHQRDQLAPGTIYRLIKINHDHGFNIILQFYVYTFHARPTDA
jgi:hypothetical protein